MSRINFARLRHKDAAVGLLALAASLAMPSGALFAQTASQITPPSYAPPLSQSSAQVVIPEGSGLQAPEGADALYVTLADVTVESSAQPVDMAMLAQLRSRLVGKAITVAEIFAAARDLEQSYAQRGKVLVRVSVPAQQLDDGAALRLQLISGFIEAVHTDNLPPAVRGRIAAVMAPLVGRSDVTLAMLERRLLLASDTPGTSLRSTLAAGSTPGGTLLVIEGDHAPVSGYVSADNSLSSSLGRYGFGIGVNFNSVLGLGESIYLRANGLPNTGREVSFLDPTPRNRALAAGILLPIGHDGLTVNIEATDARTAPRRYGSSLGSGSRFQRLSGRISYPFIRSRALTLSGEAAFDAQEERVSVIHPLTLPLSLDRLRIVRTSVSAYGVMSGGTFYSADVEGSFGLNALGARSAADATGILPLSRQQADASFQKLAVRLQLDQALGGGLAISLRGRGQTSFGDALLNAEQFGLAATDGISPLPSGALQGDAGVMGRAELSHSIAPIAGRLQIAPYLFGAAGAVRYEAPTVVERSSTSAAAFGVGARVTLRPSASLAPWSVGLEWGRAQVAGSMPDSDRLNASIVIRF